MDPVIDPIRFRRKAAASLGAGGNGGGNVDDILKRLGAVETHLSAIAPTLPHLSTKAEVMGLKAEIASMETRIVALENRIIRWIIGTVLTAASLGFGIAKFVN